MRSMETYLLPHEGGFRTTPELSDRPARDLVLFSGLTAGCFGRATGKNRVALRFFGLRGSCMWRKLQRNPGKSPLFRSLTVLVQSGWRSSPVRNYLRVYSG